jgi:hypothetical protein
MSVFKRASLLKAHEAICEYVQGEVDDGFKTAIESLGKYKAKFDPYWIQSSIHDIVSKCAPLSMFKVDQKTLKAIVIFLVKGENLKMPQWGKLEDYQLASVESMMTDFITDRCEVINPSHPIKCVKWVETDAPGKRVGNLRLRVNFEKGAAAEENDDFFEGPAPVPTKEPKFVPMSMFLALQKQVEELTRRLTELENYDEVEESDAEESEFRISPANEALLAGDSE